jgi:hypothetical protein
MATPTQTVSTRSSWWYIGRLIVFRPGRYLLSTVGTISFYLWPLRVLRPS